MAARLLGLRVRIPPEARKSVSCECCVLSGRGLSDGPIHTREKSEIRTRNGPNSATRHEDMGWKSSSTDINAGTRWGKRLISGFGRLRSK